MSYVELSTFKQYIKQNASFNSLEDQVLQGALDAAEASINEMLQRRVEVLDETPSVRTFPVRSDGVAIIDDATTVTHINGVAIDADLYQLQPLTSRTGAVSPYTRIAAFSSFPWNRWGTVDVTGTWGWATIPPQIVEACKILAKDILSNRDVSFGIAAFTEYAGIRARQNPQVFDLIAPFRTVAAFGIG